MRVLLLPLLFLAPQVLAQTAPLNDTGQDLCFDSGVRAPCTEVNTGDDSTHPRQDGRFGRDAQAGAGTLVKQGEGAAGFDFTKICNSGEPAGTGACPADPALGAGDNDWACTRDNVTRLIWEVKVNNGSHLRNRFHTYTWYDGSEGSLGTNTCNGTLSSYSDQCNIFNFQLAVNAVELCDYTNWRVPTRRELLSIVHHGAASSPRIDTTFFPNTIENWYWSSDRNALDLNANPWCILFGNGNSNRCPTPSWNVRLVRGGQ